MPDPQISALARRVRNLEKARLAAKQPTLAFSTIEDGTLTAVDEDGALKMMIGKQYDGTQTVNIVSGPIPPQPTPAVVLPVLDGAKVRWDGLFVDATVAPLDFTRVELHMSSDPDFTAEFADTLVGTFETPRGGEVYVGVPVPGTYYFRLVTRSQSGQRSAASTVVSAVVETVGDLIPEGSDGDAPTTAPTVTATAGLMAVNLRWDAVANGSPVNYDVAVGTAPGFDPAANIVGNTPATLLQVSRLADGSKMLSTVLEVDGTYTPVFYYFKVRAVDVDGPGPWSAEVSAQPRTASVDEISADYAYLGTVSFNQLSGGTITNDFTLSGKFSTGESGARVETSPLGINIYDTDSLRISMPTDVDQKATFRGAATIDGLTVEDGLEVRGKLNKFNIGSKVILQAKQEGSATPPGVVIDYPTQGFPGWLDDGYLSIAGWTEDSLYETPMTTWRFFESSGFRWGPGGTQYYRFPEVLDNQGNNRATYNAIGGITTVYDGSNWLHVTVGYSWTAGASSGVWQARVWNLASMTQTVAPTLVRTINLGALNNIYGAMLVGPDLTDTANFCVGEMLYDRKVQLRRYNASTGAQVGSTVTSTVQTPINDYTTIEGVSYGTETVYKIGTGSAGIWAVGINVGEAAAYPNATMLFYNAGGTALLSQHQFELDGRCQVDAQREFMGGFKKWVSWKYGSNLLTEYTDITWQTESSKWHTGYTWWDSDPSGAGGATHESNLSVMNSFTMKKHARVSFQAPPLPDPAAGKGEPRGVDDVHGVQWYLGRGASAPARTAMWQQTTYAGDEELVYTLDTDLLPAFSGTVNPPASTTFPNAASARFESSGATDGVPKFYLTGDGESHFEALDVSGEGAASLSGKAFDQLYYSIRAQSQMLGGGVKSCDASYNVNWTQRFILMAMGRSNNLFPGGHHDINIPNGWTVAGKEVASNVARLRVGMSSYVTARLRRGETITVSGVGAPFDGKQVVTKIVTVSATQFDVYFNVTNANITYVASGGTVYPTVQGYGGATDGVFSSSTLNIPSWNALWYKVPYGFGGGTTPGVNGVESAASYSLTTNVATIVLSNAGTHKFGMNDTISVVGCGILDGDRTITAITDNSISFNLTNANIASTAADPGAIVRPSGKSTWAGNFRMTSYTSDFTVPNDWVLLCVRNNDLATTEWVTGEQVDPGYDSDSPVLKQVILASTSDASTASGNKPALRVGSISGQHLRIDGNEVLSMADTNTQGSLSLNGGGQVNMTNLQVNGVFDNPGMPTGSYAANANINPSGARLRRDTSSRRYKENEEVIELDVDQILALEPKKFQRNDYRDPLTDELIGYSPDNPWHYGFIAEDAEALGLLNWVVYKADAEPGEEVDGFAYDKWVVALQAVAQAQQKQIADLTERLAAVEGKVD